MVEEIYLAVTYTVQVTSSSMRLIKLLPTIYCGCNRLHQAKIFPNVHWFPFSSGSSSYLEQLHQLMQTFLLFCTKKLTFFYFTNSSLQNTHINLSILHIYSIKIFILFTIFYYSLPHYLSLTDPIQNPSLFHHLSLSQTQSISLSLSHQPNNNYNHLIAAAQFPNLSLALL